MSGLSSLVVDQSSEAWSMTTPGQMSVWCGLGIAKLSDDAASHTRSRIYHVHTDDGLDSKMRARFALKVVSQRMHQRLSKTWFFSNRLNYIYKNIKIPRFRTRLLHLVIDRNLTNKKIVIWRFANFMIHTYSSISWRSGFCNLINNWLYFGGIFISQFSMK